MKAAVIMKSLVELDVSYNVIGEYITMIIIMIVIIMLVVFITPDIIIRSA